MFRRDPLANPAPLIKRVYAYVAYCIGDGPEAEDITSETFERALRYRSSYKPSQGEPVTCVLNSAPMWATKSRNPVSASSAAEGSTGARGRRG